MKHDSMDIHVRGKSTFVNDISTPDHSLHAFVFCSPVASGILKTYDLEKARALEGVVAILTSVDIPGLNQMGAIVEDEPVLVEEKIEFCGQALFLIAAESIDIAKRAASLIVYEIEESAPVLSLEDAMANGEIILEPKQIKRGNPKEVIESAELTIEGQLKTGAQEHWYLETQSCLALPGDGEEMKIISSTQNPSEVQSIVANALGWQKMQVEVEVRRLGGGFGGKETQASHVAVWTALLAWNTKRPVKLCLERDDDQRMTGKRHPMLANYKVAFDNAGMILAVDLEINFNAGAFADLSMAILERALFHVDNAYYIPALRVIGKNYKTNIPPNTAFRGFGAPQGMALIETVVDRVARYLKKDSAEIRYMNFYGVNDRNTTHYDQLVANNRLFTIWDQLIESSEYFKRREQIETFNNRSRYVKRGLALTPLKFGISFTASFLNQAGALVNVYKDGSVLINHGGIEMGQGLHTKIIQIAAVEFGLTYDRIKVNSTNTSKVPNTSATAASSGSDLNGMAVKNAIYTLKLRIAELALTMLKDKEVLRNDSEKARIPDKRDKSRDNPEVVDSEVSNSVLDEIEFRNNRIYSVLEPEKSVAFETVILEAYLKQISLSATGFYRTPGLYFNRIKGKGNPFYYYSFGMAVSEVELDILTGYSTVLRTDILHDAGKSINKTLDREQVRGGFIQGMGWVTCEECKWDEKGRLLNYSPSTYKIPGIRDIPKDFRISLLEGYPNPNTIRQSKAVGEPPFMLALSVWMAVKDAVSAVNNHETEPDFEIPATQEKVVLWSAFADATVLRTMTR